MRALFRFKNCMHYRIGLLCAIAILFTDIVLAQSNEIVGSLGGEVCVSPMGLATYSIPIEVSPGTNGIQPNLAIVYNSSSGRGYLGTNCTLAGLSSITRIQRTKYPDGSVGTINFDGDDRFAIDGAKLMKLSEGNYAVSGALYGSEIENFTRVVLGGTPNTESQFFAAVTDEGYIIEYGKTDDSKQKTSNYNKIVSWMANKITDAYGNYMTISYGQIPSNGEIFPVDIFYTGNNATGLTPYANVHFRYITDLNVNTSYIGGQIIRPTQLLESISVLFEEHLVREYRFEYSYDRSTRLNAVILRDASGVELTRTTFDWGNDDNTISCQTFDNYYSNYNICVGDYNGDNIADLCLYAINSSFCNWQIRLGNRTGDFVSSSYSGSIYGVSQLFTIDLTGKGKDGLGYCQYNTSTHKYTYKVIEAVENPSHTTDYSGKETNIVYLGDFYGVGGTQFMFRSQPVGDNVTLTLVKTPLDTLQVALSVHKNSRISVTDFDGNGKSDIQVVLGTTVDIYEYDEQSFSFVKILNLGGITAGSSKDFFGDINGDGKQDYIHFKSGVWYLNMSKGIAYNGDQTLPFLVNSTQSNGEPYYPIFVVDINGDGKDDIIQPVLNTYTNETTIYIYYSRGYDGGNYNYYSKILHDENISLCGDSYYRFADLNCDGKTEMLYTGAVSITPVLVSFSEKREHDLIHTFTNGIGKCSTLEYAYCNTPNIGYFGRDGKRVGFPIVSKQNEPDGLGNTTETIYTYGYAEFDLARRQMMGFGLLDIHCNGTNTQLDYQYDDDYHHMGLKHSVTYYMQRRNGEGGYIGDSAYWSNGRIDNIYYYEVVNELSCLGLSYGRFIPYHPCSSTLDRLKNAHVLTRCWLNSNTRRLEKQSVEHRDIEANSWVSRDSVAYTYIDVPLLNGQTVKKISTVQTWNMRNGFNEMPTKYTAYIYSHGGLSSVEVSDSDGGIGTTSYDYNCFGLSTREIFEPNGMADRTKRFSYDEKGRFLTGELNVLGHERSYTYDNMTGLMTSQADANGLITCYEYDDLGRLTRLTRPDHTERHFRYEWNDISAFSNAVYCIVESENGSPRIRTYYDVLGRAVHIYKEGRGYDDIVYNKRGLVSNTTYVPYSNPNVVFDNKTWHNNTYDNYNRIASETDPYTDLSYSYYDYNNPTMHEYFVRVDDNIRNVYGIKKYDALGRITQSADAASSVNYSYAYETNSGVIQDKMTIVVEGGTTTVISDIRGNRLRLEDPDAGIITCTYNVMNQLVSRSDANGNQTMYTYDLGGRTTQIVYSNGQQSETIIYIYDNASGAGIGQLASVKKNGSNDCVFAYDELGRLAIKEVYDDNTPYRHRYGYNFLGQLQYFTYPDGFCIKNVYNSYGELEQIRNDRDNSLIYSTDTRNKFRQPLKCRYGNGSGVQYSYNSYGLLTGIKNGDIVNGYNLNSIPPGDVNYSIDNRYRQLNYTYDNKGFIASRTDSKVNQTETYSYDNLDRLISYAINGVVAASFTYANSGNISTNSKVGTYSYSNNKPHAVTGIAGNIACPISASQCDVSYNLRNKPTCISENGYSITLDYDAAGMRRHAYFRQGNTNQKSKARISDVHEVELAPGLNRRLDYIYAEGQLVAVHVKRGSIDSLYYVMTDHLGSWNKVMDESKNIVQQTHFDPWGNRMSYTAWNTPQTQISFCFDRGFTGHEHYDRFKIINANARLYDPVIGRFFSPDPLVQVPDFSQSFNRYSYCLNNPVMYNDPDGEFFWAPVIVGAMVGAYFGAVRAGIQGGSAGDCMLGMFKGGFVGGLGGLLGGVGGAGMNFGQNLLLGTAEGAFTGGVDAMLWGEDVGKGMLYGAITGAVLTTLTSENLKNVFRGKGFKTNANVFKDFQLGLHTEEGDCWQQKAIDYFFGEGAGRYNPDLESITSPGADYWGATNRVSGDISFGNLAFEDYTSFYGTYIKESYTSNRIKSGLSIHEIPDEFKGLAYETYLEEIHGYIHEFKNQGLVSYSPRLNKSPFQGIEYYQTQLRWINVSYPEYPKLFDWIYKIPRRW